MTIALTPPDATTPRPVPYDPELVPGLESFLGALQPPDDAPAAGSRSDADPTPADRERFAELAPPMAEQVRGHDVVWEDRTIPGPAGAPDVLVTIVRPRVRPAAPGPGFLSIHGGGMIVGTRLMGTAEIIDYAERYGATGVSVEYRLAPEHPGPAQGEDCYAALLWMHAHAAELDIDPDRIVATGASAGGGLSAIVALMARDRGGPRLAGQLLNCPMLDDRNQTVSTYQYDGFGSWDRGANDAAWNAITGADRHTDRVSAYTAAARAVDLSGLPPAYIDVGAAETFRDESVDYALRIWATGGEAELHVWSGAYHGFAELSPTAAVSRAAQETRRSWLARVLEL